MPDMICIYTDGACIGNPGPGGFAGIVECDGATHAVRGGEHDTTNNRMELRAAIEALRLLDSVNGSKDMDICIFTDSRYMVDAFSRWVGGWRQNGWLTKTKQPVKNADLWKDMLDATDGKSVFFRWIKGHNNHTMNELCDRMAKEQAEKAAGRIEPFIVSDSPTIA